MWMRTRHSWELQERDATPEAVFLDRRRALAASATSAIVAPTNQWRLREPLA